MLAIPYLCGAKKTNDMDASIMQKAFGISEQECLGMRREGNEIYLYIKTQREKLCCPVCGSHHVVCDGMSCRRFVSVPLGRATTYLEMRVQRVKCLDCGNVRQEKLDFAKGKRRHTVAFANMVMDLSRFATIKDIAWFLGVSWDMVRNIQMDFLKKEYAHPDLSEVRHIGIDEFAIRKGHTYKTIVMDLDTGRIIHVGEGNGGSALEGFWDRLGERGKERIKAVCTDMSKAFTCLGHH